MVTSESSHTEDAEGSEDADYDAETPAAAAQSDAMDDASSDEVSSRPRKRKASVEDDSYMMKDPELYGLRRSVRLPTTCCRAVTDSHLQGRSRPNRRIVSVDLCTGSSKAYRSL